MGNQASSGKVKGKIHTSTVKKQIEAGDTVPNVTLKVRVRRRTEDQTDSFEWRDVQSLDLFRNKKVVLFAIAGGKSFTY